MAKSKQSGLMQFLEVAGTVATIGWLLSLLPTTAGGEVIARLDDLSTPEPQPNSYAVMYGADTGGIDYTGIAGLGAVTGAALAVTDDLAAPLKLRRMQVVRADMPVATNALRVITQNTQQRAPLRLTRYTPDVVRNIVRRFGQTLENAAALHNVPAQLLATKISIENPDLLIRVSTGDEKATGLMQITPGTADNALYAEYQKGLLQQAEADYFRSALGANRFAAVLSGRRVHTVADLQNPTYCIHIGALAFGQYLRKYVTASGEVQLYKAAALYNRGDVALRYNAIANSPDELMSYDRAHYGKPGMTDTTKYYIMQYCGPTGALDYITRNNIFA